MRTVFETVSQMAILGPSSCRPRCCSKRIFGGLFEDMSAKVFKKAVLRLLIGLMKDFYRSPTGRTFFRNVLVFESSKSRKSSYVRCYRSSL